VCAAEFCRQQPNFSGDLAENIWPELATLLVDLKRSILF
jgi:hypothetical protein